MLRLVALLAAALLFACNGGVQVAAGEGVIVDRDDEQTTASVDPSKVPLIESCAPEEAILRAANGWVCGGVPEESLSGQERAQFTAQAAELAELIAETSSRAAQVRERLMVLEGLMRSARMMFDRQRAPHSVSTAANTCLPAPEPWQDGQIFIEESVVKLQGTDKLELFCGFIRPSGDSGWRIGRWDYLDQGNVFGTDVLKGQLLNFRVGASDTISSSWTTAEVGAGGAVSYPTLINQLPDPAVGYPYHRMEYFTPAGGSEIGFVGVAAQPFPYSPPELQTIGGVVFIDFGAPKETADETRRWLDDDVFLNGGPESGLVRENEDSFLDREALLPPENRFHEAVLKSERYCNCDLRISIGAPDGLYLVRYYFFESDTGLVTPLDEYSRSIGGRIELVVQYSGSEDATLSALIVRRMD